ncbi:MAG TPA: FAD-dependent oxidoreductase [Lentisphaeria bacterium]|nr:FAD-dependent oxidoreductase [Lentisphaeria bacterium]
MDKKPKTDYDVIVLGFGTAGAIAAIAAGRMGASVLVLEQNTYAGGTQSGGGITGFYGGPPPYGLTGEINAKIKAAVEAGGYGGELEVRKWILEEEALRAGVDIRYEITFYDVLREGRRVTGVRWSESRVLYEAKCRVLIDSSAEAVACRLAGCELLSGRATDGLYNTFTNTCLASNGNRVAGMNFDAGRINQYDPEVFSQTMLETAALHVLEDYAADSTTCGRAGHRVTLSDLPGIREGFHVLTEEVLTIDDVFLGDAAQLPDPIAYVFTNLDTHTNDMPLESELFQDWMVGASMWGTQLWFPVIRENLVPKDWTGILAAARHLGVDHDIGQAVRMNGPMGRIGEVAGVLAALAAQAGHGDCLVVPIESLKRRLEDIPDRRGENEAVWGLPVEAIRTGLESDRPGFAIWSARHQRRAEELRTWYADAAPGSHLRRHAAMALALLGDRAGVDELRQAVVERDPFLPLTSRHSNHVRGYACLYLLGRLRDVESLELFFDVLKDDAIQNKYEYHTHAVAALIKVGEAHSDKRAAIAEFLRTLAEDPAWELRARLKETQNYPRIDQLFRLRIAVVLRQWGVPNQIGQAVFAMPLNAHDRALAEKVLGNTVKLA